MRSYLRFTLIFLFTLGIFLLQTPSSFAGYEHNIRGEALAIGGAYEGNMRSLMFDGVDDYIDLSSINTISLTNVTVSFWRKASDSTRWLLLRGQSNSQYLMAIGTGNFYHANVGTGLKIYEDTQEVVKDTRDGKWRHYVVTGVNLSSWTTITLNNYSSWQYKGGLNDLRIYNRTLSAEEINRLYRGVEISNDDLVGHWKLDEGSGTTASDSSGNNNNGTLVNGPVWSTDIPEIRNRFVYFNCLDEPHGSFTYIFPFPLGGNPCDVEHQGLTGLVDNYGVNLDYGDYTFDGYALHDEFGLISFRNGIPSVENYDFVSSCSNTNPADCNSTNNCSACYDEASQRVHGWVYVVEEDAWIKLNSDEIKEIDKMRIFNYESAKAGDFYGLFYHDNWGIVDLNCSESTYPCSPSYKVYLGKVGLAEMSAPYWGESKACSQTAKGAVLRWKIHGGYFNRYEIRINNQDNFNTAYTYSLAQGEPGYNRFQTTIGEHGFNYPLDWDTSYTWWLRLHDDVLYSTSTEWIQFNHSGTADVKGILTENSAGNTAVSFAPHLTFTTYKHEWPRPYFTWEGHPATSFQAGAPNKFEVTSASRYYTGPSTSLNFGHSSFVENFRWWGTIEGVESSDITIVDVAEFPDSPNPIFHLDASTILGLEHNDFLATWEDISINNYHITQSTQSKMPKYRINALNGRPAVYFDGTDDSMINDSLAVSQPFNIFVVAKSEANLDNTYLFDSNVEAGTALGYSEDSQYLMWAGEALKGGSINDNLSLWSAFYHTNNSNLQIKQSSGITQTINNASMTEFLNNKDGLVIGASRNEDKYWQGYIAEVIIYSGTLNNTQRQNIEDYLALKWGIDENDEATASHVYVYFESIADNQKIWLSLTDPTGYKCSTSTPSLDVNYALPLWREIRARE